MMDAVGLRRRAVLLGTVGVGLLPMAARANERVGRALGLPAVQVARPTQAVLQAVARAGKRMVAVGERGLVIYSNDGGQSWVQARVPVSCTLTALRFADAQRGWAVGSMGVVLATEDGGASWRRCLDGQTAARLALQAAQAQLQASPPGSEAMAQGNLLVEDAQRLVAEGADKPLLDIALGDDGALWAVGAYGLAFSSTDGGREWQSQMHRLPNPDGLSYYGLVSRKGEQLLFGEQGLVLGRRTGGVSGNFSAQPSPSNGSLFGALALREGSLLMLGLRGKLWRSAEPGDAWTAVQTPVDASLVAGTQLADGSVLLVGAAGQVLLSRDGGQRFHPLALPQRFPFTGLAEADDGTVLLVGMRGLLRLTPAELTAAASSSPSSSVRKSPV